MKGLRFFDYEIPLRHKFLEPLRARRREHEENFSRNLSVFQKLRAEKGISYLMNMTSRKRISLDLIYKTYRRNGGFSLMELLVVISIFVIMSLIGFASIPDFRSQSKINSAVNDALEFVREARKNSSSVKEFRDTGIFPSYGVYFDISTPQRLLMYADCKIDDNGDNIIDNRDNFTYNPSLTQCAGSNGYVKELTLDPAVAITGIQSITTGSPVSESRAYIEYVRPEPTMWLSDTNGSVLSFGKIKVTFTESQRGAKKTITIWSTGHIEVE